MKTTRNIRRWHLEETYSPSNGHVSVSHATKYTVGILIRPINPRTSTPNWPPARINYRHTLPVLFVAVGRNIGRGVGWVYLNYMKLQCKSSCLLGLNFVFQTFSSVIELSFVHMTNKPLFHTQIFVIVDCTFSANVCTPAITICSWGWVGVMRLQMYLLTLKPHYNSTQ